MAVILALKIDKFGGHIAYVDSLSLISTRKNLKYYNSIHAQRLLERKK